MLQRLWSSDRAGLLGLVIFVLLVISAIFAPLLAPHDPLVWYKEKTISAVGEGIATIAALIGIFVGGPERRSARGDS